MTLTEYLKNPRILTNRELSEIDAELDAINARLEELNPDNCTDDLLFEHYEGRLDAIEIITEMSYKLARRRESGFQLIQGGAA
jgi:hypothetical protein